MIKAGSTVQILYSGSGYFNNKAIVRHISNGQYCVEMEDGYLEIFSERELGIAHP